MASLATSAPDCEEACWDFADLRVNRRYIRSLKAATVRPMHNMQCIAYAFIMHRNTILTAIMLSSLSVSLYRYLPTGVHVDPRYIFLCALTCNGQGVLRRSSVLKLRLAHALGAQEWVLKLQTVPYIRAREQPLGTYIHTLMDAGIPCLTSNGRLLI